MAAQQLEALAKYFMDYCKKVPGKTPTSYIMDHTAHACVFDTRRKIRPVARYGMGAKAPAGDLWQLL